MTTSLADLPSLRSSTTALLRGLGDEKWSDADVRAPSLLPGWTRGHVLTHIARNADGITRTLGGALHGKILARYPDGMVGRNADIEAGASRPMAEQIADVRESAQRLDEAFAAIADADGWQLQCDDRTAGAYLAGRWNEVEVHRVDLAGSYTADQWPAAFVRYLLPATVAGLDPRIPEGRALRVEVDPDGSLASELGGTVWTCGSGGEPEAVSGPDWALLAWALGRHDAVRGEFSATPELARWR